MPLLVVQLVKKLATPKSALQGVGSEKNDVRRPAMSAPVDR